MAKIKKEKPIVAEKPPIKEVIEDKAIDKMVGEVTTKPVFEITPEPPPSPKVIIISGGNFVPAEVPKMVGESFEERLLNFIKDKGAVQVNDFLKLEFKEAAKLQVVNKGLKGKLASLVAQKKIQIKDNAHLKLGGFFYVDSNPETQYHTMKNLKLEITAL